MGVYPETGPGDGSMAVDLTEWDGWDEVRFGIMLNLFHEWHNGELRMRARGEWREVVCG